MTEYKVSEKVVKNDLKFTFIFCFILVICVLGLNLFGLIKSGVDYKGILFIIGLSLVGIVLIFVISFRKIKIRLENIKLILEADYLVWFGFDGEIAKISYSDIKQIKKKQNNKIEIKLKNSPRQIYILGPQFFKDIDSIFELLQKEIDIS